MKTLFQTEDDQGEDGYEITHKKSVLIDSKMSVQCDVFHIYMVK